MRLGTRVFLLYFLSCSVLLTGSFWAIQKLVQSTVRNGLRTTLRESQLSLARTRSRADLENSRFLRVAGENAALKAGMQLLLSAPPSSQANQMARATVEDQLADLCGRMGFDFLAVSDPQGMPLAGIVRQPSALTTVSGSLPPLRDRGLLMLSGKLYQIVTVPIDQGDENLGSVSVGEVLDLAQFNSPAVLLHNSKVIQSTVPGAGIDAATQAFRKCGANQECDVALGGVDYLSLPMPNIVRGATPGDGYQLRSLQNLDAAFGPVRNPLRNLFLVTGFGALGVALIFSALASGSIVKPIVAITSHLRRSETTGLLPEFGQDVSSVKEVRELATSFNRAAAAIKEARTDLQMAYVEFVGSLANALDARDPYTAGHSQRVSELSCATALAIGLGGSEVSEIRIGALLHDSGKIGISDSILRKPGKLTDEEFAIIRQHPVIGRRILEGVQGFSPYLASVELHHENWDGSGYPHGQAGEETPLAARIIHVADAYDAMTSDRPYRPGMPHEKAISILAEQAGRQFDPRVVSAFAGLAAHPAAFGSRLERV